jgi:hypothetical protein
VEERPETEHTLYFTAFSDAMTAALLCYVVALSAALQCGDVRANDGGGGDGSYIKTHLLAKEKGYVLRARAIYYILYGKHALAKVARLLCTVCGEV